MTNILALTMKKSSIIRGIFIDIEALFVYTYKDYVKGGLLRRA